MSVPRLPSSEWRKRVEALALEFGASVEVTNSEHVRFTLPNGRRLCAQMTPRHPETAALNLRTRLRRKAG